MALEKNTNIYYAGFIIGIVWDIIQTIMVRNNAILFSSSIIVLIITIFGLFITLADEDNLRKIWMVFYVIPAGLSAFGALQGYFEMQNSLLSDLNLPNLELPFPGTSKDYSSAVTSHYLSMLAAPASWAMAYLVPLLAKLIRSLRS
ncbi:MAG: hypothetical protein WBF84_01690 [Castellaniella sp.]|uniref:hypothetical protein n=1 Tax=Castellaniella sp. TaxID=1955812 RepID=UPI003C774E69